MICLRSFFCVLAGAITVGALGQADTARATPPETIVGHARVIDGDTLDIVGRRIRLEGIDAPETGQRCARAWWPGTWRCGRAATRALRSLIGRQPVRCVRKGVDRYDRIIATCFVGQTDLNAAMVRDGHAWAFRKYSTTYVDEESVARTGKRGVWRAPTETPWAYRAQKWTVSEQAAPDGCAIKGNISSNGRIYHMPWSPWYKRVRIDTGKGERWFCSEQAAQAAGWRPVGAET